MSFDDTVTHNMAYLQTVITYKLMRGGGGHILHTDSHPWLICNPAVTYNPDMLVNN